MNMQFPLRFADIVLPNMEVRAMHTDFRILQQIANSKENRASDLPRRAMKAANAMMDAFRRVPGDKEKPELLSPVILSCRKIAWEILGPLSDADKAALAPSDPNVQQDAKIWAVGHW
jgi:hypothetical protein